MVAALDLSDFSKEEIKKTLNEIRHPVDVAVYGSGNYFNTGTIIRACHNFLVSNIYLVDTQVQDAYFKKATMGSHRYENIHRTTLNDFFKFTDENKKEVVAFERRPTLSTKTIYGFTYPKNPILLFGCERFGVPDEVLEKFPQNIVSIPQYGLLHDYNLSNCVAIAIYDWMNKHYASK